MKTKIVIEFDGEISEEKLQELMGEISATCSEDSSGAGWTAGTPKIESYREEDTQEFYDYVASELETWSSDDIRQWVIQYGQLEGFTQTFYEYEKNEE